MTYAFLHPDPATKSVRAEMEEGGLRKTIRVQLTTSSATTLLAEIRYIPPQVSTNVTSRASSKVVKPRYPLDSRHFRTHILTVWRIHPMQLSSERPRAESWWCRQSAAHVTRKALA